MENDLTQYNFRLYHYAFKLTKNSDEALDLVSTAFYRELKNPSGLNGKELGTRLAVIIRNEYRDQLRRKYARANYIDRAKDNLPHTENSNDNETKLRIKEIMTVIRKKNPIYMEIINLMRLGFNQKEIAERTNTNYNTMRARMRFIKKLLRGAAILILLMVAVSCNNFLCKENVKVYDTVTVNIYDTVPVNVPVLKDSVVYSYKDSTIYNYQDSITENSGIIIQNVNGNQIIRGNTQRAQFNFDMEKFQIIIRNDTLYEIRDKDTLVIPPRPRPEKKARIDPTLNRI